MITIPEGEAMLEQGKAGMMQIIEFDKLFCKISEGRPAYFHIFRFLPLELRLKIWKLALPDPRFVDLCSKIRKAIPSILQACSESRLEAKRSLKTVRICICMGTNHYTRVYVNVVSDTVALRDCSVNPFYPLVSEVCLLRYFDKFSVVRVRHIFIGSRFWELALNNRTYWEDLERLFRTGALETVVVDCRRVVDQLFNDLSAIKYLEPKKLEMHKKWMGLMEKSGCNWEGHLIYAGSSKEI